MGLPTTHLFHLAPGVRAAEGPPPWQQVTLVARAGMRGVVTMAVAFALAEPEEEAAARVLGEHGPALVIAAFSVVVATLLVQGSTLPWLVRRLRVRGPDPAEDALQQALVLQHAVDAGRRRLEELALGAPRDVVANLDLWSERLAHASWERLGGTRGETSTAAFRRLRLEMLTAERAVVVEAHRSGRVPGDVLEGALERLDLEEAMIADLVQEDAASGDGVGRQLVAGDAGACEHLRSEPLDVAPQTSDECPDCLALGEREWVHLRMCVRCGHVGCCDSSPRRHADARFRSSEHPVMRSIEVGEGWRWCFLDRVTG